MKYLILISTFLAYSCSEKITIESALDEIKQVLNEKESKVSYQEPEQITKSLMTQVPFEFFIRNKQPLTSVIFNPTSNQQLSNQWSLIRHFTPGAKNKAYSIYNIDSKKYIKSSGSLCNGFEGTWTGNSYDSDRYELSGGIFTYENQCQAQFLYKLNNEPQIIQKFTVEFSEKKVSFKNKGIISKVSYSKDDFTLELNEDGLVGKSVDQKGHESRVKLLKVKSDQEYNCNEFNGVIYGKFGKYLFEGPVIDTGDSNCYVDLTVYNWVSYWIFGADKSAVDPVAFQRFMITKQNSKFLLKQINFIKKISQYKVNDLELREEYHPYGLIFDDDFSSKSDICITEVIKNSAAYHSGMQAKSCIKTISSKHNEHKISNGYEVKSFLRKNGKYNSPITLSYLTPSRKMNNVTLYPSKTIKVLKGEAKLRVGKTKVLASLTRYDDSNKFLFVDYEQSTRFSVSSNHPDNFKLKTNDSSFDRLITFSQSDLILKSEIMQLVADFDDSKPSGACRSEKPIVEVKKVHIEDGLSMKETIRLEKEVAETHKFSFELSTAINVEWMGKLTFPMVGETGLTSSFSLDNTNTREQVLTKTRTERFEREVSFEEPGDHQFTGIIKNECKETSFNAIIKVQSDNQYPRRLSANTPPKLSKLDGQSLEKYLIQKGGLAQNDILHVGHDFVMIKVRTIYQSSLWRSEGTHSYK
jgi:hypothetical protein